jgi:hypothetical protein
MRKGLGRHNRRSPGTFNPGVLFANGEQGFWYDPTDIPLAWRRNLLTYTEQFDNAAWTKANSTITADAAVAPDGTTTADKLVENTANAIHSIGQGKTFSAGTYCISVYAKGSERTRLEIATQPMDVGFDLANGTILYGTGGTITAEGNGWYRCVVAFTPSSSLNTEIRLLNATSQRTYTGDGTSGLFIWGAQLELGSTASTYQQIVTPEISFLQYQSQPVLYQDSAGTTPVTAVEQAVGLMLDKSKGLVLGSERMANGTFASGTTGWSSFQATLSAVGGWGLATSTVSTGAAQIYQSFNAPALNGKWYLFSAKYRNKTSSGAARLIIYNISAGFASITTVSSSAASGTLSCIGFVPATGDMQVVCEFATNAIGESIEWDDVSLRELPGNHAFQTSSTKRPVLRARYNLLTYSEQFDNAVWTKGSATITANSAVAPDGTTTADKLVENTAFGAHQVFVSFTFAVNVAYSWSVYAKAAERSWIWVNAQDGSDNRTWFDLANGAVGTNSAGNAASITSVGNGWYRCSVSRTTAAASGFFAAGLATADNTATYTGDGASGAFIWGADLRPTSQATGLIGPTYQRIAAATDYDVVGFLPYLAFEIDDALTTNSIDFSGTDKMTVFAGVRKLSDATDALLVELSVNAPISTRAFYLAAPESASLLSYSFFGLGAAAASPNQRAGTALATYPAPITNVLTTTGDIPGDLNTIRVNGIAGTSATGDQGTGNYGNYPLFIGARNQTSVYFNGWIYSLIGRGAATTAGQIAATEQWVAGKSGVQL